MITANEATAIIGFPDITLTKLMQGHQLANRAFRYLYAVQGELSHEEQIGTFQALVKAINVARPEWVCQGPYDAADGLKVFVGPNNYHMLFNPNLEIYFGRFTDAKPGPDWKPNYRQTITLDELTTRMAI